MRLIRDLIDALRGLTAAVNALRETVAAHTKAVEKAGGGGGGPMEPL